MVEVDRRTVVVEEEETSCLTWWMLTIESGSVRGIATTTVTGIEIEEEAGGTTEGMIDGTTDETIVEEVEVVEGTGMIVAGMGRGMVVGTREEEEGEGAVVVGRAVHHREGTGRGENETI